MLNIDTWMNVDLRFDISIVFLDRVKHTRASSGVIARNNRMEQSVGYLLNFVTGRKTFLTIFFSAEFIRSRTSLS